MILYYNITFRTFEKVGIFRPIIGIRPWLYGELPLYLQHKQ